MHIVVIGVNHQSAPIELRERLAFHPDDLPEAFARLRTDYGVQESLILSTCNRVEIYASVPDLSRTSDDLRSYLGRRGNVEKEALNTSIYRYAEPDSIAHLFSVASGLDSMVLGEGEILGQVKHAYERAKTHGATGKVLNVLFQKAINTAKAVRTQTAIGCGHASVGTLAVDLAEKIFGDLANQRVLLIGAGKIGELTLKHLLVRGMGEVKVMNRSPSRAQDLALAYGALPVSFLELDTQIAEADIVIASTSAAQAFLSASRVEQAMRLRRHRPLCLVDLGVPRNIENAVGALENVYLFNIDDLQGLLAYSVKTRQDAVAESRAIINQKAERFLAWWRSEAPCLNLSSAHAAAP